MSPVVREGTSVPTYVSQDREGSMFKVGVRRHCSRTVPPQKVVLSSYIGVFVSCPTQLYVLSQRLVYQLKKSGSVIRRKVSLFSLVLSVSNLFFCET